MKKENGKTPLQNDKKEVVEEILEKHDTKGTETDQPKKKRKYTKRKPEAVVPEYSEENAINDSNFLCELVNEFRASSGVPPAKEKHLVFFAMSSKQLFIKYGSATTRWMPEIMFAGTLFFITADTYKEMQILKAKELEKKKEKIPTKKAGIIK